MDRVTTLTGLDRDVVARAEGRIDSIDFAREALRDEGLRVERLRRDGDGGLNRGRGAGGGAAATRCSTR